MAGKRTDPEYRKGGSGDGRRRGYSERAQQESVELAARRLSREHKRIVDAWVDIEPALAAAAREMRALSRELLEAGQEGTLGSGWAALAEQCELALAKARGEI